MFRLKLARGIAEIERLRPAWDSLFNSELTLFQSHRWNLLAARCFADREAPYFIFCESDNGAAIVPAVRRREADAMGLAGEQLFDYRDYLARGDETPLQRAWQKLSDAGLPLDITAIRNPGAVVWNRLPTQHFSRAPRLNCEGWTRERFTHSHPRAFSRLRKFERMGLAICEYSGDSRMAAHIYRLRSRQSAPGEIFHDPVRVEFMIEACRAEENACEIFTLEHGSTVAAALVTFRDGNCRRFYTTYYDHAWARYSPGVTLLFEISRRSIEQGLDFDFMTGEQAYKLRIAPDAEDLYCVRASSEELRAAFAAPGVAGQKPSAA